MKCLIQPFQLTASRRGWRFVPPSRMITIYFNSQPHEEADRNAKFICNLMIHFNSQPHEEADPVHKNHQNIYVHFNSQPHEEADYDFQIFTIDFIHFNSQPHEEADHRPRKSWSCLLYFNSQPHEEADRISSCFAFVIVEFQLTASRRGWLLAFPHFTRDFVFQLTASRRGWHERMRLLGVWEDISTHSLTKRLTAILDKNTFI